MKEIQAYDVTSQKAFWYIKVTLMNGKELDFTKSLDFYTYSDFYFTCDGENGKIDYK